MPRMMKIRMTSMQKCRVLRICVITFLSLPFAVRSSAEVESILFSMASITGACRFTSSSISPPRLRKTRRPLEISSKPLSCCFFLSSNSCRNARLSSVCDMSVAPSIAALIAASSTTMPFLFFAPLAPLPLAPSPTVVLGGGGGTLRVTPSGTHSIWYSKSFMSSSRFARSFSVSFFAPFAANLRSLGSSPRRKFFERRISAFAVASAARLVSSLMDSAFSWMSRRLCLRE
mmetsp:Transcript_8505/g.36039  ORF Transcript_8505/g.36039 Transcript_8505/m.36039 type:complete len:231 (+) Transcript_8505:991-1683(+)